MPKRSALSFIIVIALSNFSVSRGFGVSLRGLQTNIGIRKSTTQNSISADRNTHAGQIIRHTKQKRRAIKKVAESTLSFLTIASAIAALSPPPAHAAAKAAAETAEHLHLGQKVANYFRSFGIPDLAILAIISSMPVVELRGAVPVGVWMGLNPLTQVLPVCVVGNMAPIFLLLLLLRNDRLKELMKPVLTRAEKKSASLGVGSVEKQWASLAAFVGIPLPGTGAWTGAMGAFLLGMPYAVALSSIFAGVVSAGVIMTAITLAGRKGGVTALAVLGVIAAREFMAESHEEEMEPLSRVEETVEEETND